LRIFAPVDDLHGSQKDVEKRNETVGEKVKEKGRGGERERERKKKREREKEKERE